MSALSHPADGERPLRRPGSERSPRPGAEGTARGSSRPGPAAHGGGPGAGRPPDPDGRLRTAGTDGLGSMLRRHRRARAWSQRRLAQELCTAAGLATVSRHEVSRWEREERVPSAYWCRWLALVLGVRHDLLDRAVAAARSARAAGPPPVTASSWPWRVLPIRLAARGDDTTQTQSPGRPRGTATPGAGRATVTPDARRRAAARGGERTTTGHTGACTVPDRDGTAIAAGAAVMGATRRRGGADRAASADHTGGADNAGVRSARARGAGPAASPAAADATGRSEATGRAAGEGGYARAGPAPPSQDTPDIDDVAHRPGTNVTRPVPRDVRGHALRLPSRRGEDRHRPIRDPGPRGGRTGPVPAGPTGPPGSDRPGSGRRRRRDRGPRARTRQAAPAGLRLLGIPGRRRRRPSGDRHRARRTGTPAGQRADPRRRYRRLGHPAR